MSLCLVSETKLNSLETASKAKQCEQWEHWAKIAYNGLPLPLCYHVYILQKKSAKFARFFVLEECSISWRHFACLSSLAPNEMDANNYINWVWHGSCVLREGFYIVNNLFKDCLQNIGAPTLVFEPNDDKQSSTFSVSRACIARSFFAWSLLHPLHAVERIHRQILV